MYRMNQNSARTPRDRLDPHMLERIAMQRNSGDEQGCGCGNNDDNMRSRERSSCSSCDNERSTRNIERSGCGCSNNDNDTRSNERSPYSGYGRNRSMRSSCGCGSDDNMRSRERTARNVDGNGCGCDSDDYNAEFNHSLAMVYSPYQEWQNLYCEEDGMNAGTIFRELDKSFYGSKCRGGNNNE